MPFVCRIIERLMHCNFWSAMAQNFKIFLSLKSVPFLHFICFERRFSELVFDYRVCSKNCLERWHGRPPRQTRVHRRFSRLLLFSLCFRLSFSRRMDKIPIICYCSKLSAYIDTRVRKCCVCLAGARGRLWKGIAKTIVGTELSECDKKGRDGRRARHTPVVVVVLVERQWLVIVLMERILFGCCLASRLYLAATQSRTRELALPWTSCL